MNNLTKEKQLQILQLQYAKDRLIYNDDFYEFLKASWKVLEPYNPLDENWHIKYLCMVAQNLTENLLASKPAIHKTVLINVPPRSLKSWIFNIALPVWAWTKNPSLPIITCSYSLDLGLGFSRKSQALIKSNWFKYRYADIVKIEQSEGGREAVGETETSKEGVRYVASTEGTIVGKGFLLGVVDDPIKPSEARSPKSLESNVLFWNESFDTRRNNPRNALAFVIMQRVAQNDLSGYLIEHFGDEPHFLHINLPAVSDGSEKVPYLEDFLKKYPSEVNNVYKNKYLFGDRFDESFISQQKKKGTIFWNTQYQQNPLPSDGLTFKRDWFGKISVDEFRNLERRYPIKRTFILDTAYTLDTLNDPTGFMVYSTIDGICYIIHYESKYVESAYLPDEIVNYTNRHNYTKSNSLVLIEPKGSGKMVVSLTKRLTKLNVAEYKYPKSAQTNINVKKELRAEAITPMTESGKVVLVEGAWNEPFLDEVVTFPLNKHDESVDCMVMAVLRSHYIDTRYRKFGMKRTN